MHRAFVIGMAVVALAIGTSSSSIVTSSAQQAQPRRPADTSQRAEPKRQPPADSRAQPRAPAAPRTKQAQPAQAPPRQPSQASRQAQPRTQAPPPRVVPPRYHVHPRAYYFPPISVHRGFYYHPYFGFYYGPYYGPFYPYPGPYLGSSYSVAAIRTRVRPVDTHVYVNGYYAGLVDDFDGAFQRLHVPAGTHEIAFHLDGYHSFVLKLYLGPGDTREITHEMVPLGPGDTRASPPQPGILADEWTPRETTPIAGDRPASPFGILGIRVSPAEAAILLDGETWPRAEGRMELVVHLTSGWHHVEVRKDGYQPFVTDIELSEGVTTRLNVELVRAGT